MLDREGAAALAKKIRQHWIDRGFLGIRAWIEESQAFDAQMGRYEHVYVVCSNIGAAGFPPHAPAPGYQLAA
jgi:hypothetical protein